MAVAETKGEVTAVNARRINRTERMITTTSIKRIIIIIITGDTITGGAVLLNVAENQAKTEITVPVTEALMIFTDAGIFL